MDKIEIRVQVSPVSDGDLVTHKPSVGEARPANVRRIAQDLYIVTGIALGDRPMTKPSHQMRIEKQGHHFELEASSGQRSSWSSLRRARIAAREWEFPSSAPHYDKHGAL